MDDTTWAGVESLIDDYAAVESGDTVVVAYTPDSCEVAAWVCAALELRNIFPTRVWMAPIIDPEFGDRFTSALPDFDAFSGRLVVLTFERDTMSHTGTIAAALAPLDKRRCAVFRAISSGPDLFSSALQAKPQELSARNAALLQRLMPARQLRITTAGGTDLVVGIDSDRHRWISNRGVWRPGSTVILPAGEVATFPASMSGVLVADFAFNVNATTDNDARLGENPVTIEIAEGRAVKYACNDPITYRFLDESFSTYCAYNVGELGFGTNFQVERAIGLNSHINERRPGVHVGFGQHNQDPGIVGYQCAIHLDLIADGGMVWVDDDPDPIDLRRVAPSAAAHPTSSRDEDVFSPELCDLEVDDCCGILTTDGFRLFTSLAS